MVPRRFRLLPVAVALTCLLGISSGAFGQKINLGIIAGGNLTDDFRSGTYTPPKNFIGVQGWYVSDASQWFMIGPAFELQLPGRISAEIDAVRRRIRSTTVTVYSAPLELPDGSSITSVGPFTSDGFTWQFSLLGKYRISDRNVRPFVELGPSFLPQENRDQTGITFGSGVEAPLWRLNVAPTLRYTRWINNESPGGVRDQFQFLIQVHEQSESIRPRAFGRPLSLGFVAGFGITKLLRYRSDPVFLSVLDSDSHTPIGGVMIEVPIRTGLSLEMDGLYRSTHDISGRILPDGSIRYSRNHASALLTWQFPVLAKYRMPVSKVTPIIELGPSFRAIGHGNSEDHSHHGITGGVGVSTRVAGLNIAPTVRYTHWAADKDRFGQEPYGAIRPNQFEVVMGFSF